jgi:hypothetical protein
MNPLSKLPAPVRLWVYVIATLALLVVGAWQASEGDWIKFVGLLATALVTATAGSNVKAP